MTAIRTLIVDDEPLARERIRQLLASESGVEVIGECREGTEAVEVVRSRHPDLLVLDIQMPGLDGFAVLRALERESLPVTIFTTAYDEYALQAFEVHALDYVLKPVDADRFREAVERARQALAQRDAVELREKLLRVARDAEAAASHRIVVKSGLRTLLIRPEEIDWVESAGNYVRIHHGSESHLLRETMSGIEKRLPDNDFVRIQRTVIVNIARVTELRKRGRDRHSVILQSGKELPLGRVFRANLEERLRRL